MKLTSVIYNDISNMIEHSDVMEELRGNSFLITGATGFIGSYLIHTLLLDARMHQASTVVYAMVRSVIKARDMFFLYKEGTEIIYIEQDVCDAIKMENPVDYIIHCASNAAPKEYAEDPVGTININFMGSYHLLNFARDYLRKRFLYVSTIEIYGKVTDIPSIYENEYGVIDSCNPRSCYPISKKACETMCVSFGKQYRIPLSIARLAYIYGPGMREDDSKVAALFPREVAAGHDIIMKSRGEQKRSYCYVCDAISGMLTILSRGKDQEAYNVASSLAITTIYHMAEQLVSLFPEKKLKVIFDLPSDAEKQAFSFIDDIILNSEKLESLGWQPVTQLDDGLRKTVLNHKADITTDLPTDHLVF